MAHIIYTNGLVQEINPDNKHDFSLEELQRIVHGYIELIHLPKNRLMIINEDGKFEGLPVNILATREILSHGFNDVIVGDVLICNSDEVL